MEVQWGNCDVAEAWTEVWAQTKALCSPWPSVLSFRKGQLEPVLQRLGSNSGLGNSSESFQKEMPLIRMRQKSLIHYFLSDFICLMSKGTGQKTQRLRDTSSGYHSYCSKQIIHNHITGVYYC